MTGVDKLLQRLDGVRSTGRGQWIARCPSHEDRSPSLSVAEAADGRVLVHCFGGCAAADVVDAAGLTFADLFPERDPDDAGRRPGWRTAGVRDSRQGRARISAQTALAALAGDATTAAVIASDLAEGRVDPISARERLFLIAGRIAATLRIVGF